MSGHRPPDRSAPLLDYYQALLEAAGHRGWWPGRTRLEIILGAILTQNTAWKNVEKALAALKARGLLRLDRLRSLPEEELAGIIRPSGYFRQKARKIRAFLALLDGSYRGSLSAMGRAPVDRLRRDLLEVWGIGPETADSIILYAFRRPAFVVDAYTMRVLTRHGLLPHRAGYAECQRLLVEGIPEDLALYNDFHAQFVWVGHHYCGPTPHCDACPLRRFLGPRGPAMPPRKRSRRRAD